MAAKRFTTALATVLTVAIGGASIAAATVHPPDFNPDDFVNPIPNPFFPLEPGTTFFYQGVSDGVVTSNTTEVTCFTEEIAGVTTTVIHDQAFEGDPPKLVEDTRDFYAQDNDGNVWYFGEDTKEYDPVTGELISTAGTWREGEDDADAGFIMLADPQVGDRYFQEFAPRVAVDQAKVISLDGSTTVQYPPGDFDDLLVTKETSQLDPGVVENKYYAEDIGFIRSEIVKGGDEFTELVDITTGNCQP